MSTRIGILGGVGPLASAAFVQTICRAAAAGGPEQGAPALLLASDPSLPDRTRALTEPALRDALLRQTERLLRWLVDGGASDLVLCCFTLHAFLPQLPPPLVARVRSLPAEMVRQVARRRLRTLLLCTSGSRRARVFEREPGWDEAAPFVVHPTPEDQDRIHALIYALKLGKEPRRAALELRDLAAPYGVEAVALGCTELHLLEAEATGHQVIDPLATIAEGLRRVRALDQLLRPTIDA